VTDGERSRVVAPGLFDPGRDGEPPALLGSRCKLCGEVLFPATPDCPACTTYASMEPFRLRGEGVLRDFIVVHRGPKGFAVPYVQGYITLDDGPIVYSMIDAPPEEDALVLGERVVMTIAPLRHDEDGVAVLGWKFRPVRAGAEA
jgi:uncharacterized OB-fold protein